MKLYKSVVSTEYPTLKITQTNVYVPINIIENIKKNDDIEYIEYIYDEEEYTVQEYILKLNIQITSLNEVTDCLILESLL